MHNFKIHHTLHRNDTTVVSFSSEILEKVQQIILRYPQGKEKSALIPILHIAQEELGGWLSPAVMNYVADLLKIQPIEVYEVATFYTQFYTQETGKYVIEVCQTASCAICGGEEIIEHLEKKLSIKNGETTSDGLFTLKAVECLGGCGYAPVMQVNTEFHEHLTIPKIDNIIDNLKSSKNLEKSKESKWVEKFF